MVGESMSELVVPETSLTSCSTWINIRPLSLTRGVTDRTTPVSRYCTELTTRLSSLRPVAVCVMIGT
ncbi:hypothetical protein D3C75_984790 [compost metagenome]